MKKYGYGLTIIFFLAVVITYGQSVVQSPKVKKVYISCQQYLELAGSIIASTNDLIGVCSDLLKICFELQKKSLFTINAHIDGDKNCFLQQANKVERTDKYTKLVKIKDELEDCIDSLNKKKQSLDIAIADFDK